MDGEVSSGSQYRLNGKLWKKRHVPIEVIAFAEKMAKVYSPAPVFVMDVCEWRDEFKIVEIGCFNSAGFYDSDIEKIVYDVSKYAERNE